MDRKKGVLAVISGFSGVGKGTAVKELLKKFPYALSVSATTSNPRPGEVPGVSYHYITKMCSGLYDIDLFLINPCCLSLNSFDCRILNRL